MLFSSIAFGKKYLTHWLNAIDEHSLQAPFVYDFYTRVVKNRNFNHPYHEVQKLRSRLKNDRRQITLVNLGAGSHRSGSRSVAYLARTSHQPKVSRLLFSLTRRYQPQSILEFGTSLGLSALHMWAGVPQARIRTFEGNPEICNIAKNNFQLLGAQNIELLEGDIDNRLKKTIRGIDKIDLLFMDANHRYKPTIDYFTRCCSKFHDQTIVVIDDIHWSTSMEQAWKEIRSYDKVSLSVDLFYAGVVFFNRDLSKSHFVMSW